MAAKRDRNSYIKLPEPLKKRIEKEARRNMRTFSEQAIWLMARGLHEQQFNVDAYTDEGSNGHNAG